MTLAVAALLESTPASGITCPFPTQRFGPTGEFHPITAAQVAQYTDCVREEGRIVEKDPNSFLPQRNRTDAVANGVARMAQAFAGLSPFTTILGGLEITFRSTEQTAAVQEGYRRRVADLQSRHAALRGADGMSIEEARTFRQALAELETYLRQGLERTQVPAERETILEALGQISHMDVAVQADALTALARSSGKVDESTRAAARELVGSNAALVSRVDSLFGVLATIAEDRLRPSQSELEQQAHRAAVAQIADVAHLTQGLVGVAALGGIISPDDAATLQGVVGGAAQLATAARIWSDGVNNAIAAGTAGSAAGPYGMAIAGGLAIVSSLQQRGPSEGEQLAAMLAQISKQIDRLQRTVDRGFEGVHESMAQSEQRLMRQLTQILARTDQILVATSQVREDIASLRRDIAATALSQRNEENVAFLRSVVGPDDRCLQVLTGSELSFCIDRFNSLSEEFDAEANARLAGLPADPLDDRRPAADQLRAIHAVAIRALGTSPGLRPVHGPGLDLLADRVYLFFAHNPDVMAGPGAAALRARIGRLIQERDRFEAALNAPETRLRLRQVYEESLVALLAAMDRQGRNWVDTATITGTDEVARAAIASASSPSSWRQRAARFPATADPMVRDSRGMLVHRTSAGPRVVPLARFIGEPPLPQLDLQQVVDSATTHRTLREKLTNYARATAYKDSADVVLFPETLRGLFWVEPCENAPNGSLPFPVTRQALATMLPPSLVALTAVSRDRVTICYAAQVTDEDESVAIGNTRGGIATVSERLATLGFRRGVPNSGFLRARNPLQSFCYQQPGAFFGVRHRQYAEFRASDFESCHKGDHIHHKLWMRAGVKRVSGVTYHVSIALPGYRGAATQLQAAVRYPFGPLDRCLTMLTPQNTFDPASLFAPFRFQYPLPVTRGCPGIDAQLVPAVKGISASLARFLDSTMTRREGDVQAPLITVRAAVDSTLGLLRRDQAQRWVAVLMGDTAQWRNIDRLSTLARLLPQMERPDTTVQVVLASSAGDGVAANGASAVADSTDLRDVPWLTRHELQYMLQELIRDDEMQRVRSASSLADVLLGRARFEAAGAAEAAELEEVEPTLVAPTVGPESVGGGKAMPSADMPTRKPTLVIVPATMGAPR